MKKFVKKLFLFSLLILAVDVMLGVFVNNVYFNIYNSSPRFKINQTLLHKYDVYVMGSSSASHGYVPDVISRELGMSVFNAGTDTAGILYHYSVLQLILSQNKPKLIIWDVSNADYFYAQKNAHIETLLPYAKKDKDIYELLIRIDPINRLKIASNMVTYNQKLIDLVWSLMSKQTQGEYDGYEPLYGTLNLSKLDGWYNFYDQEEKMFRNRKGPTKHNKMMAEYFDRFIDICYKNDIKLIAFLPPRAPIDDKWAHKAMIEPEIVEHLKKREVPFIQILSGDYISLQGFHLYKDISHLNHEGALIYSELVADFISNILNTSDEKTNNKFNLLQTK